MEEGQGGSQMEGGEGGPTGEEGGGEGAEGGVEGETEEEGAQAGVEGEVEEEGAEGGVEDHPLGSQEGRLECSMLGNLSRRKWRWKRIQ